MGETNAVAANLTCDITPEEIERFTRITGIHESCDGFALGPIDMISMLQEDYWGELDLQLSQMCSEIETRQRLKQAARFLKRKQR